MRILCKPLSSSTPIIIGNHEYKSDRKRSDKGSAAQSANSGWRLRNSGRTIDKCRALVAGNIGEYHFDCPLDNMLFGFKGVKGDDFKAQIENGASDEEMVEWLNRNGEKKTPDEIKRWGDEVEATNPLRQSGETRVVRRTTETTRTRSKDNDVVRLARERRQSESRAESRVSPSGRRLTELSILGFDQRRRLIFGITGVFAAAEFAVANAVEEINAQDRSRARRRSGSTFRAAG